MVPSLSVDAAGKFPEGYFDWLFLDALHTREAVLQDLEAWWPRLRAGGLCSGDDYGERGMSDEALPRMLSMPTQTQKQVLSEGYYRWL